MSWLVMLSLVPTKIAHSVQEKNKWYIWACVHSSVSRIHTSENVVVDRNLGDKDVFSMYIWTYIYIHIVTICKNLKLFSKKILY